MEWLDGVVGRFSGWFEQNWAKILEILWYIWSGYWWLIVGVTLAAMVITVAAGRLERRPIYLLKPTREPKRQNAYMRAMNAMAAKLGFLHCGWFSGRARRFKPRVVATMWLSADAVTLVVVGVGRIGGLKVEKTSLFSKPVGGALLMTTDIISDPDISGTVDQQELLNADMGELYELHRRRVEEWGGKFETFRRSSVLDECEEFERRRVEVLVDYKLAKWVGLGCKKWRYSMKGAILKYRAYRANWKAMKKQGDRFLKKRPGET